MEGIDISNVYAGVVTPGWGLWLAAIGALGLREPEPEPSPDARAP